jgi:succinyl-diaminopimelate desuccinylase
MPPFDLSVSAVDVTRQLCDVESVSGNEQSVADSIWQTLEGHDHLTLFRDGDAIVARTELGPTTTASSTCGGAAPST